MTDLTTTTTSSAPATRSAGGGAARVARVAGAVTVLSMVWAVQYVAVVPVVYTWRACVWLVTAGLKLGVLGVLLLCLPIVGWILLAILLVMRHQHAQTMAAMGHGRGARARANVLRPWGLQYLR